MSLAPTGTTLFFPALDVLPYGIIVIDAEGRVVFFNRTEAERAGMRAEDVIGRNFFTEIAPCVAVQAFQEPYRRAMDEHETSARLVEFTFHFPIPGRPRDVEVILTPFDHDGERLCLIAIHDITRTRLLRERIARDERLRPAVLAAARTAERFHVLLDRLAADIDASDDETDQYRQRLRSAIDDGLRLADRLRLIADWRPRRSTTTAALAEVIDDLIADVRRRQPMADVSRTIANDLPPVHLDAEPLRIMLKTLVDNAVDAAGNLPVSIDVERDDGRVMVTIADHGPGLDQAEQERLFSPLQSPDDATDAGLGLATAYALTRQFGIDVDVRSAPGRGTAIILHLPTDDAGD